LSINSTFIFKLELLRRIAEGMLVDMVQLLFARLPQFKEEISKSFSNFKKLTMKSGEQGQKKTKKSYLKPSKSVASTLLDATKDVDENDENKRSESSTTTISNSESAFNLSTETKTTSNNIKIDIHPDELNAVNAVLDRIETAERLKNDSESSENTTTAAASTTNVNNDETSLDKQETDQTEEEEEGGGGGGEEKQEQSDVDYVNPRGVRFVQDNGPNSLNAINIPYGLPCVRELLRFLISLINMKNSETMITIGLNLITIAFESGIDHISSFSTLISYVKDDLCKNLFSLLSTDRLPIFATVLRSTFLLFESLRGHLKLQMEYYFNKLMDIIVNESTKITPEQKEITIDYILQMLRIPGFAIEIYLNYDCSLNCTNLFEDLTKLLSKNVFSAQNLLTANSLSLSALLTIIENIENENSISKTNSDNKLKLFNQTQGPAIGIATPPVSSGYSFAHQTLKTGGISKSASKGSIPYRPQDSNRSLLRINRMHDSENDELPSHQSLKATRLKKKLLMQSIDLFNNSPAKAIQFLKDNQIFSTDTDACMSELIEYMRETPTLNKRVIGDYISNRKNSTILEAFVNSFHFKNMRIDEGLRIFLEAFRLPGEAPLIAAIMEHFARHWCNSNPNAGFANQDAAFTLAYAIIMLNVDLHNPNVKKQSIPMTLADFKKNVSKCNGDGNFDDQLLNDIYAAIKAEEIVMPAEHTGIVRDNYLWKVLIRRCQYCTLDTNYIHAPAGSYNHEIFSIVWGQTISALSFVYDKSLELSVIKKTINGFQKCAQVAAYYGMSDVFDNIVISLCKFTSLSTSSSSLSSSMLSAASSTVSSLPSPHSPSSSSSSNLQTNHHQFNSNQAPFNETLSQQLAVNFGLNNKAQLACKTVFQLTHNHGDILRDGWKNIFDCIVQLYRAKLLPKVLIECEDYLHPKGRIILIKENEIPLIPKSEGSGIFSSFFPFMSNDLSMNKGPTAEEQEATKSAQQCVEECHIEQLIHDTKFLRVESLIELVKALIYLSSQPADSNENHNSNTSATTSPNNNPTLNSNSSDAAVFSLEILVKVVLQNRDRIVYIWPLVRNHFYNIFITSAHEHSHVSFFLERAIVGLLRISARLLRREELVDEVLASLRMLLLFKKKPFIKRLSRQVAFGLYDLLKTNAANIYSNEDWSNIFAILEVFGAGANLSISLNNEDSSSATTTTTTTGTNYNQFERQLTNSETKNRLITSNSINTFLNYDLAATTKSLTTSISQQTSDHDRGYTSDSEIYQQQQQQQIDTELADTLEKLIIKKRDSQPGMSLSNTSDYSLTGISQANQYKIDLDDESLGQHDRKAFAKCIEILTFLIRDMAHITLQNFESCIHCLRTFVEACVTGDKLATLKKDQHNNLNSNKHNNNKKKQQNNKSIKEQTIKGSNSKKTKGAATTSTTNNNNSDDDDLDDQLITSYETMSIQLLDLLDTLHIKAASIFTNWADEQKRISSSTTTITKITQTTVVSNLWSKCWCPILQGIARLSCDRNGEVRMHALQYLQRALLVHELQTLSAMEWEACFNKVLFPLLGKLLENIDQHDDSVKMEETRMRASTLLCKVFLQHLTTLARLSTFTALWLTILDYMDKYMKSDKSDLLVTILFYFNTFKLTAFYY
jgi:golgi-specific brefeldin A-resistance guanine nucleotide exchange factor 1